ncbi:MAG TPA: hypothetical protein GXZ70_07435 [Clostridiales bacterium]|nr:hypothetical protein [Clostridiales bacterium]
MKVFIIFLAILIINTSFLSYQGDMGCYIRCQNFLKAVAEECAAGAALYYDEAAYAEGLFQFSYEEGYKYIDFIINNSKNKMPLPKECTLSYEVLFEDDILGYESDNCIPSVTVIITAVTDDLFDLPFIEVTKVQRAAKYELPQ